MPGGKFDDTTTGHLAAGDTTIVSALATGERKRVFLRLANIGALPCWMTVWLLKTGETTGDSPSNAVFGPEMPLASNTRQIIREDWVLGPGDSIVGKAESADKIRFTVEVFDFNG
jgi:hypothetical protein